MGLRYVHTGKLKTYVKTVMAPKYVNITVLEILAGIAVGIADVNME